MQICKLVLENKAGVSGTPMWDILRLPRLRVRVDLCLEDEDEITRRMKSIRYLCRITCASCISHLITSGSEIGWPLGFELVFSVGMVLVSPVGYPIGDSVNMLLDLTLCNYFGTG